MMMSENYKIIAKFIKDMSSETLDTETYIFVKENIFKYQLGININSKPLKNQIIEINTNLKFEDKEDNKMKSFFEIFMGSSFCMAKRLVLKSLESRLRSSCCANDSCIFSLPK